MDQVEFGNFFNEELDPGVEGWFFRGDVLMFYVLLQTQQAAGIEGEICELGSYKGRSAIVLGKVKRPTERLFCLCRFEEQYAAEFRENVRRLMPEALSTLVAIRVPDLMELRAPPQQMDGVSLRFLHIDAGHGHREVLNDLRNFAPRVTAGGVVVLDDVFDPSFPGVATAMAEYCLSSQAEGLVPFATSPSKAYLCHRPYAPFYQRALVGSGAAGGMMVEDGLGGPVLVCFSRFDETPGQDELLAAIG